MTTNTRARFRRVSLALALGMFAFLIGWWGSGHLSWRTCVALLWSDLVLTKHALRYKTAREEAIEATATLLQRIIATQESKHP